MDRPLRRLLGAGCAAGTVTSLFLVLAATPDTAGAQARPERPARGVILIASESLRDPRFARSVVLLSDYGDKGATGVIVNRPTQVRVVDAIPAFADYIRDANKIMYYGGPVEPGVARVLVHSDEALAGGTPIQSDIQAVSKMSVLVSYFERVDFEQRARFFGGYAGWGPGQLESEIRRGDWLLTRARAETLFAASVESLWDELMAEFAGLWVEVYSHPEAERTARSLTILRSSGAAGVCEGRHELPTNAFERDSETRLRPYNLRSELLPSLSRPARANPGVAPGAR